MKHKAIGQFGLMLFFACCLVSFSSAGLSKNFAHLLTRANMIFVAPDSLMPALIIENRSMPYDYALKYPDKKFEIRYAVRPTDSVWREYEQYDYNPYATNKVVNPDSAYLSAFQTVILNCSGGESPKVTEFQKEAVNAEFGADWGGTVFIHPRMEFGQSYKYCMIVAIHKNRAGDAYIFYLSDSQDGFSEAVAPAFHSLKFK